MLNPLLQFGYDIGIAGGVEAMASFQEQVPNAFSQEICLPVHLPYWSADT